MNLDEKWGELYTYPAKCLPWALQETDEDEDTSSELDMKNMMFALMLWENEIKKSRRFRFSTGNHNSSFPEDNKYGRRSRKFLDHFTSCEGLTRVNSTVHVKRKRDLDCYARFIQPAEDLARLDLDSATNFLCKGYDIKYEKLAITQLADLVNEFYTVHL